MPRKKIDKTENKSLKIGNKGEVVIYQANDGSPALEVKVDKETVWLSQRQMASLFDKDTDTVGLHLRNIYKEDELGEEATTEDSSVVQWEGARKVKRVIKFYNLDVIISVGYRVKSKRGTQFRIWATRVLREHILKGYTLNERRLKELRQSLRLVEHVLDRHEVGSDEAKALLKVVTDYAYALELLDDYDHQRVVPGYVKKTKAKGISYNEARKVIDRLKVRFGGSDLFGKEKDDNLHSSLSAIMQTFDSRDVYPSLEEKAAHLLYFLVKNHSFVDGNKRIAAALFLWFMEKNNLLYRKDGGKRVADNALVAMTLMIAESDPAEKAAVIGITVNLINRKN
ncbi:MAG: cytochrome C biogenesis protein CycH [Desulfobacteraceae bacterium]|nr:MAG: cytochrome C biogenesis protein CycH [Desulfobacteraceae bacterium]